jgi:hypothetical protein
MRKLLLLLLLLVSAASAQKTVKVRQYTRKDGTVVSAHVRSAPKSNMATTPKAPTAPPRGATVPATRKAATTAAIAHPPAAVAPVHHNPQGQVAVRQYTRKDGTVVSAYNRSAPNSKSAATPKAPAVHPNVATVPATRKPATTTTAVAPTQRNGQGGAGK